MNRNRFNASTVAGRRVLITGAKRGIGAATAQRLHAGGAQVALAGLEPEYLAEVSARCGDAPWYECNVTERSRVEEVVTTAGSVLGGLDVVMANAGTAALAPLIGGSPALWDGILAVNVGGVYNTVQAAGPHISHRNGYVLIIASLAAAMQMPMLGAYCTSKAAVEAMGNVLRTELRPTGARVGVAYFGSIDTDMVDRGLDTESERYLLRNRGIGVPVPVKVAVDAIERGIARRSRRVVAPRWVAPLLPLRMAAQPIVEAAFGSRVERTLEMARNEHPTLTTEQPR